VQYRETLDMPTTALRVKGSTRSLNKNVKRLKRSATKQGRVPAIPTIPSAPSLHPQLVIGLRKSHAKTGGNNPKDRYGLAKVPFSLIPESASVFLALGLKHGARKYGPFNWRVEPVQGRVYLEAARRHLALLLDGEDFDRDTGVHHGAFILSTIAIYMDAMVNCTLIDNRALPGRTGDLVAFFNELPGTERTKAELIEGFKALVPNNHFGKVKKHARR
jgi:hypothetical protein